MCLRAARAQSGNPPSKQTSKHGQGDALRVGNSRGSWSSDVLKSQDRIGVAHRRNFGLRLKCLDLNPYLAPSELCYSGQLFDSLPLCWSPLERGMSLRDGSDHWKRSNAHIGPDVLLIPLSIMVDNHIDLSFA